VNALVTGVAGFIGSTLAERLLSEGVNVVGIDCFTDYYPRAVKERNLSAAKPAAVQIRRIARPGRRSRGAARRLHARISCRGAGRRPQKLGPFV